MKLPPYTLVHNPMQSERHKGKLVQARLNLIHDADPRVGKALMSLTPRFRRTLLYNSFTAEPVRYDDRLLHEDMNTLAWVVDDLCRQRHVTTVGVWDLGAYVGRLNQIIETMNAAQPAFTFFQVHAVVPAGMVSRPERIASWAQENFGRTLTPEELGEIELNIIDGDFFRRAEVVRKDLGVDYLVGVTPSMVAGADENGPYWNYFSSSSSRAILISAYQLAEFAKRISRPYEDAVALLVVAQLLAALNPRLAFHEDTGCLFDFNEKREAIVRALKKPKIEPDCLKRIKPCYRDAAIKLAEALYKYPAGYSKIKPEVSGIVEGFTYSEPGLITDDPLTKFWPAQPSDIEYWRHATASAEAQESETGGAQREDQAGASAGEAAAPAGEGQSTADQAASTDDSVESTASSSE